MQLFLMSFSYIGNVVSAQLIHKETPPKLQSHSYTVISGSNKNPVGYIKDSGMCHVENYTILTFKAWELSYDY